MGSARFALWECKCRHYQLENYSSRPYNWTHAKDTIQRSTGMRTELKLAIVGAGVKYQYLAMVANQRLEPPDHLSERIITKFVTNRKPPTRQQAAALARVLGRPVAEIFPLEAMP